MENRNIIYLIGLMLIAVLDIYILIVLPHGRPFPLLQSSFFLFGLGLNSTILIWVIALFLIYRWNKTGRKNKSLIYWGFSFLVYSITFIAHIFRALGVQNANENTSGIHFFFLRVGMIIWAAGILYGLLLIVIENKNYQKIPSLMTIGVGLLIFIIGLFIIPSPNPIELTMYYFLFTIWIPICFTMAYIFFYIGIKGKQIGPKIVSIGFLGLMITYMTWAPWHYSDVIYIYFIWYFLFMLSLVPILIGFLVMSVESSK